MKKMKMPAIAMLTLAILFMSACADATGEPSPTTSPTPTQPVFETPTPTAAVDGDVTVSIHSATEELLGKYESVEEFTQAENEYSQRVLITTSATVRDFKLIALELVQDPEELIFTESELLYSMPELTPEKPLVFWESFHGVAPTRAISFLDESDVTRYFYMVISGKDGSLVLGELIPTAEGTFRMR